MENYIMLSCVDAADFIECSAHHVKVKGKLFKKQILRWGDFTNPANPQQKITVDMDFYNDLKRNFDNGVCPIVQVPLVNDKNQHVEAPDRNIGEVVDLSADEDGINVFIDARKYSEDVGVTILGASAKFHPNYTDMRTRELVGPTLIHVAATNRPALIDLTDFEEIISLSAVDTNEEVVLLTDGVNTVEISEEEPVMTQEELYAALSEQYGIDVEAGQAALAQVQGYVALSDVIGGEVVATPEGLSTLIVELSNSSAEKDTKIQELTAELQTIQLSAAAKEVESFIETGRILPAWREIMIELSVTDRERFETFLLPEEVAHVELSEVGMTTSESTQEVDPEARAKADGANYANKYVNPQD